MSFEFLKLLIYIVPGFAASMYYYKSKNESLRTIEYLIMSLIFCFIINIFSTGIILLVSGKSIFAEEFNIIYGFLGYSFFSIIAAITMPNILLLILHIRGRKKHEK